MKREKYPRIEKKDRTLYVTGDAQDWTYQYTWEDFLESFNDSSSDVSSQRNAVYKKVRTYFYHHPEEALNGPDEVVKDWTIEYIKRVCEISLL